MRSFNVVKIFESIILFGLFFSGETSQSPRCFAAAPVVECVGNMIKFYYDDEAKTCKFFKASNCHDFREGNYFDTFAQCKSSCLKGENDGQGSRDLNHFSNSNNFSESIDFSDSSEFSDSSDSSETHDNIYNEDYNDIGVKVVEGFDNDCSQSRVCICPFGMEENVQTSPLMCLPCMCKKKPPIPNCNLECPAGYVQNARGRIVCRCEESINQTCSTCKQFCRYGYLSDGNGCYYCECYIPETQLKDDITENTFFENNSTDGQLKSEEQFHLDCSSMRECGCSYGALNDETPRCLPCFCNLYPPIRDCNLKCLGGYARNAGGSFVCLCNEVEPTRSVCGKCENYCEYGYLFYEDECRSCHCFNPLN